MALNFDYWFQGYKELGFEDKDIFLALNIIKPNKAFSFLLKGPDKVLDHLKLYTKNTNQIRSLDMKFIEEHIRYLPNKHILDPKICRNSAFFNEQPIFSEFREKMYRNIKEKQIFINALMAEADKVRNNLITEESFPSSPAHFIVKSEPDPRKIHKTNDLNIRTEIFSDCLRIIRIIYNQRIFELKSLDESSLITDTEITIENFGFFTSHDEIIKYEILQLSTDNLEFYCEFSDDSTKKYGFSYQKSGFVYLIEAKSINDYILYQIPIIKLIKNIQTLENLLKLKRKKAKQYKDKARNTIWMPNKVKNIYHYPENHEFMCRLCQQNSKNTVFRNCGHSLYCNICIDSLGILLNRRIPARGLIRVCELCNKIIHKINIVHY